MLEGCLGEFTLASFIQLPFWLKEDGSSASWAQEGGSSASWNTESGVSSSWSQEGGVSTNVVEEAAIASIWTLENSPGNKP